MGNNIQQLIENFDISFESKESEDYLVLTCGIAQTIKEYQIEMISYYKNPRILMIEKCIRDTKIRLCYNVTSRLKLSEYLQKYEQSASKIVSIFTSINSLFSDCSSYLLKPSGFMIHKDYIFADPQTGEIAMVYIPIPVEGDAIQNVKELFLQIVKEQKMQSAPIDRETNITLGDYFASGIIKIPDRHSESQQLIKTGEGSKTKSYKLDEGSKGDEIPEKEIDLLSFRLKKRKLYIYFSCQFVIASIFAIAFPFLKFAAGNLVTYIGMTFLIVAVNVFVIKKIFV